MDDAEPYEEDDYEPAEDDDERDECGDFIYINTLNVKDSNYIWIFITGTSVKSLALIDSGAQVSVMPKKTFDSIPTNNRPTLRSTSVRIKAGNGSGITCHGVAPISFNFQGLNFTHNMHIVEDTMQTILGYDFLREAGDSYISPSDDTVRVRGEVLELVKPGDV